MKNIKGTQKIKQVQKFSLCILNICICNLKDIEILYSYNITALYSKQERANMQKIFSIFYFYNVYNSSNLKREEEVEK